MQNCNYFKTNGDMCRGLAIDNSRYCFFHLSQMGRRKRAAQRLRRAQRTLTLPLLEDANAIQVAIMEIIDAMVQDRIDLPRARLILRALHMASVNLKRVNIDSIYGEQLAAYPRFEAEYESTEIEAAQYDAQPLVVADRRSESAPADAPSVSQHPHQETKRKPRSVAASKPLQRRTVEPPPLSLQDKQEIVAQARSMVCDALGVFQPGAKKPSLPVQATPEAPANGTGS